MRDVLSERVVPLPRLHAFEVPAYLRRHHKACMLWSTLEEWYAKAFGPEFEQLVDRDAACEGLMERHSDVFDKALVRSTLDKLKELAPPPTCGLVFARDVGPRKGVLR